MSTIKILAARLGYPNHIPMRTLALLLLLSPLFAADYDVLIRNARVIDGSGNPWHRADLAVKDGRIAAIGRLPARHRDAHDRRPRARRRARASSTCTRTSKAAWSGIRAATISCSTASPRSSPATAAASS